MSKPEPTKPLPAVLVVRQFFVDRVAAKDQNLGQRTVIGVPLRMVA